MELNTVTCCQLQPYLCNKHSTANQPADDPAVEKFSLQNLHYRLAVLFVLEAGDDDRSVGDVEIGIAGPITLALGQDVILAGPDGSDASSSLPSGLLREGVQNKAHLAVFGSRWMKIPQQRRGGGHTACYSHQSHLSHTCNLPCVIGSAFVQNSCSKCIAYNSSQGRAGRGRADAILKMLFDLHGLKYVLQVAIGRKHPELDAAINSVLTFHGTGNRPFCPYETTH